MKIHKKIMAAGLVVCISLGYRGFNGSYNAKAYELKNGEVLAQKSETVYALLNENGSIDEISIINRISNTEGEIVVDYGEYNEVISLDNKYSVTKNKDKIKITSDENIKQSDTITYEGKTNKELPMDIKIKYYLDGKEIDAKDIKGKSGKVKISIVLENKYKLEEKVESEEMYMPLVVQVGMNLDLEKFDNIDALDATQVVSGNKLNVNYTVFPNPTEEIYLEAEVEEFELPAISFNMIPKSPVTISLEELIDPLQDMYDSMKNMKDKIPNVKVKTTNTNSLKKYEKAIADINRVSLEILNKTELLRKGIEGVELENATTALTHGLNTVSQSSNDLYTGSQNLDNGIIKVTDGIKTLDISLQELSKNQENIKMMLNKLIQEYPENKQFYESLIMQSNAIQQISGNTKVLSQESENLKKGSSDLVNGINTISQALSKMSTESINLGDGLDNIDKMLEDLNTYLDGVSSYSNGVIKFSNESKMLLGVVEEVASLTSNLGSIDTKKMDDSLNKLKESVDKLIITNEKSDIMEEAVKQYKSFANNELNTNSNVSFIIKTKDI